MQYMNAMHGPIMDFGEAGAASNSTCGVEVRIPELTMGRESGTIAHVSCPDASMVIDNATWPVPTLTTLHPDRFQDVANACKRPGCSNDFTA